MKPKQLEKIKGLYNMANLWWIVILVWGLIGLFKFLLLSSIVVWVLAMDRVKDNPQLVKDIGYLLTEIVPCFLYLFLYGVIAYGIKLIFKAWFDWIDKRKKCK